MTKPMTRVHDLLTGEVVDREMTQDEYAVWQAEVTKAEAEKEAEMQKAKQRQAVLTKLGLTVDELAAILS
jgi:hypothetical protein